MDSQSLCSKVGYSPMSAFGFTKASVELAAAPAFKQNCKVAHTKSKNRAPLKKDGHALRQWMEYFPKYVV